MVRLRYYEQDTPFGQWLRHQGQLGHLPSNSVDLGVTATDVDMVINCYKNRATGKKVKCIFWIEVKTRCGEVRFAQSEIFRMVNAFAGLKTFSGVDYRFYGVLRLRMSGTAPDNSDHMWWERWPWSKHGWKRLPEETEIQSTVIQADTLSSILRCELHPTSLKPWKVERDHHGTTTVMEVEERPLFTVERPVIKRY